LSKLKIILVIVNIFFINDLYPQNTKKATKTYKEANALYSVGDFDSAIEKFLKSLKSDPNFCPSIYKLGLSYKKKNLFSNYKNLFLSYIDKTCLKNKDEVNFYLGEYFFMSGDINNSKKYFDLVEDTLKFISLSKYKSNINYYLNNVDKELISFDSITSINKWHYQYTPYFNPNTNTLFFTARDGGNLLDDENVITASFVNDNFLDFKKFNILNSENNEGTPTFSSDGKLMVYTSCEMDFKNNSCDIYFSRKRGNLWSKPRKFDDNINSQYWDSQPFIYGSKLYFVSNRPGGAGGRDIYYSNIYDDGTFSKSYNFSIVNTQFEEVSPFIDNGIFYFSSNRNDSYGGYDIFLLENNIIFNLGMSVNSHLDESSIYIWDNNILLTVEDVKSKNKSEIVYGEIIKKYLSPINKRIIKTFDFQTKEEIFSDLFVLKEDERRKIGYEIHLDEEIIRNSTIVAESEGYFPTTINDLSSDTIIIFLKRLNENIVLENIYFEFDSYYLSKESKEYLTIIAEWLGNKKFKNIEVSGHADDIGSKEYNFGLSESRAKAVVEYILSINSKIRNITYKGYGNSVPIEPNFIGPENRRIEFRITN
jgi:outer membrane protein OmpA-like peptidoglycan-associated protein/tetratricopeptide (TPR) repeat protein